MSNFISTPCPPADPAVGAMPEQPAHWQNLPSLETQSKHPHGRYEITSIYCAVMLEIERRRLALNLPMEKFSEYAGLPERYYSKALYAHTASGRQAKWETLQVMIEALFPRGFDVEIRPRPGSVISPDNLKAKLLQLRALYDRPSQRELMRELGRKGAKRSVEVRRERSRLKRASQEADGKVKHD